MSGPTTTVFPVGSLPSCVSSCGPMFDVNGACVPPATTAAAATAYGSCFCGDARLTAFSSTTAGVCDAACAATPSDLATIQSWYSSYCLSIHKNAVAAVTTASSAGAGLTGATSSKSASSSGSKSWISTHWQWVIFLVIIVIAIVGSWVGAAMWRKRYLARQDRRLLLQGSATPHTAGSGPGDAPFLTSAATEKSPGKWWSR